MKNILLSLAVATALFAGSFASTADARPRGYYGGYSYRPYYSASYRPYYRPYYGGYYRSYYPRYYTPGNYYGGYYPRYYNYGYGYPTYGPRVGVTIGRGGVYVY